MVSRAASTLLLFPHPALFHGGLVRIGDRVLGRLQPRNHSTQYTAFPAFPWHKLRNENPGVYESYVDLVPGEWTHVKIEVDGTQALSKVTISSRGSAGSGSD
jgi:hypothetical protein